MACLFLFNLFVVQAQHFSFTGATRKAYGEVLNLHTDAARSMVPKPVTPQEIYVVSLSEALELLVSEDHARFFNFESDIENWTDLKADKKNRDELLLLAELHLHRAFVNLKFGNEFDAAFAMRQSWVIIRDLRQRFPDYAAALKTSGLLNIIFGSVPDKYNWVLSLLGMQGSVSTGLQELRTLTSTNHDLAFEATLWYAFIEGFVLQQPDEAIMQLKLLLHARPQNKMALFLLANIHIKNAGSEEALKMLTTLDEAKDGLSIPYVKYLMGEVLLHKGDYPKAIGSYRSFLDRYKGQNYIKDAHYKIGMCYWLDGDKDAALNAFALAGSAGREATEADRHAAKSLSEIDLPSIPLTKARFYTDGGYYKEAQAQLSSINEQSLSIKRHQVEYHYRKARLAHKMNDLASAKDLYSRTITQTGDEEWYFAPNAWLQLGYIALSEKDSATARSCFQKALGYRKHEYKNSIDSKARSALAQLRDFK